MCLANCSRGFELNWFCTETQHSCQSTLDVLSVFIVSSKEFQMDLNTYVPLVGHSTLPWAQNKVCGKTKNNCSQSLGANAEYWSGSCSLCSTNTAILCFTVIPSDCYLDHRAPTCALNVSLFPSNIPISHESFDLNSNCKIPGFRVDSVIPSGLDSARHLNATSSFRHRHALRIRLISEPTAHGNSSQKVNLALPRVQMWEWEGQLLGVSVKERGWREVRGPHARAEHVPSAAHQALPSRCRALQQFAWTQRTVSHPVCFPLCTTKLACKVAGGQGHKRCRTKPRNYIPASKFWSPQASIIRYNTGQQKTPIF